jgi:hypothetical protein
VQPPRKIYLNYAEIRVELVPSEQLPEGDCGEWSSAHKLIRVDRALDPIEMINTLWHEIKHAGGFLTGLKFDGGEDRDKKGDDEERVVTVTTNFEIEALRRNPRLRRFLNWALDR